MHRADWQPSRPGLGPEQIALEFMTEWTSMESTELEHFGVTGQQAGNLARKHGWEPHYLKGQGKDQGIFYRVKK
jgi:hypothetical protein